MYLSNPKPLIPFTNPFFKLYNDWFTRSTTGLTVGPRSENMASDTLANQTVIAEPAPTAGTAAAQAVANDDALCVRGARVHNLKNIDFDIPHNQLTVVTGVSGSGKSSLAFDTVYAEGQRRYVESLSAYARQFLERMEKPDVDEVTGIAPAVAIRQKNSTRNPRSTVATATEIYDYVRLLFARIGVTTCHQCGEKVGRDNVDGIAGRVLALEAGRRFYILFQVNPGVTIREGKSAAADAAHPTRAKNKTGGYPTKRAGGSVRSDPSSGAGLKVGVAARPPAAPDETLKSRLFALRQNGFNRLFQSGRVFEFSAPESLLEIDFSKPVFVLVDRLAIGPEIRQRLIDSLEICYRESGEAILEFVAPENKNGKNESSPVPPGRLAFNERFECKRCSIVYQEPEPRLFSFNNPFGACPRCQGFGNTVDFDLDLVIPDKNKTLGDGAVVPWTRPRYRTYYNDMKQAARVAGVPLDVPYFRLTAAQREWVMNGQNKFAGIRGFFKYLERKKYKLYVRVFLSRFRGYALCPECLGGRLRREALNVRVNGRTIVEAGRMAIQEAYQFFNELRLSPADETVAEKVLEEVQSRLKFLYKVGLEYLTLDRLASTLSGGESQRIQLATALGSNLVGALYVLDEPSIGLHPRDTTRLIEILKNLRDIGNTILVVEHDPEMMRHADKILDLGPGAGEHGGKVVYSGDWKGLLADAHSLTGRYLSGQLEIPLPAERRYPGKARLKIRGARQHNLKSIDVEIPLGLMVCVSGVSGSGKSTLVHDVLYNALLARRGQTAARAEYEGIEGDGAVADIVLVDQSPLGRTPRSNPITYIKAFDAVREVFAATPEARKQGADAGRFSFNIPGGRCETCQGDGTVTVEMQFLADVELVCEECRGRRFKPAILDVRYKRKNIYDVLQMTVKEALAFFSNAPKITGKIRVLDEVGLGYLRLGQSATTLSGGEAQRVRLAAHLAHQTSEGVLFIFDEPTTGLHFDDINKLLAAFRKLIEAGASVLIIEHNLEVLKMADWIIDLGPEGGDGGGYLVAAGTPEDLMRTRSSHTGKFLASYLAKHG
ncbi:MAG TPA: excinuclease ABC subunit UvrA [Terriglobia bacterium]|nr:excinuclease ABC subunit UvrA [Terriglobia bacterium]